MNLETYNDFIRKQKHPSGLLYEDIFNWIASIPRQRGLRATQDLKAYALDGLPKSLSASDVSLLILNMDREKYRVMYFKVWHIMNKGLHYSTDAMYGQYTIAGLLRRCVENGEIVRVEEVCKSEYRVYMAMYPELCNSFEREGYDHNGLRVTKTRQEVLKFTKIEGYEKSKVIHTHA